MVDYPRQIGQFDVIRPLGRGFYGAAFVASQRNLLRTKRVIKVSPIKLYEKFGKNFAGECEIHGQVADGADHVVTINDAFDSDVEFSGLLIPCHVAVLDFIDGEPLKKYIDGECPLNASEAAQIAADLFRIKHELEAKRVNHNDLHAGNIVVQRLSRGAQRLNAMEPSIRAVAIDLGSLAPDRRSGGGKCGDLHWIARHIQSMVDRITADLDSASDIDSRVANALQIIVQSIITNVEYQRTPSADDFIRAIEQEYWRTAEPWRPWRDRFELKQFGASYNAQTMEAWHVPKLLVDPEHKWLARVSAPGPLIITGMRGCGKTMVLRALQFHARAAHQTADEKDQHIAKRLGNDKYVGLFVSAYRLLTVAEEPLVATYDLFARLYVAYALEAVRALAHLADIDGDQLIHGGALGIARAISDLLSPEVNIPELVTLDQFERFLGDLLIKISKRGSGASLCVHPATAFPHLAQQIRNAAAIWRDAQVLFLLDDVSTRYLTLNRVEDILSALIFQHPICAFKLTSEAQSILLDLKSPGQVEPAAHWRDYQTFDLGAEVHSRLKEPGGGPKFVAAILQQRARYFPRHPRNTPRDVLGDVDLEQIARTIAKTSRESRERKHVYRGISALTGICVGDMGSVIRLYEDVLERSRQKFPVPANIQSEIFRDFCSWHLYHLDRRGSDLKDVAKSFAEASHELLVQSGNSDRLRQYASIYVRVTTGNFVLQMNRLRELIDAGIFVFTGGAPRTKTRDKNPVQQFKLTYRKIYGLTNFIGLSERDRFELSGENLVEWLNNPANGKNILMRNLRTDGDPDYEAADDATGLEQNQLFQRSLDLILPSIENRPNGDLADNPIDGIIKAGHLPLPIINERSLDSVAGEAIDTLVIGLGFEKRTLDSLSRILDVVTPSKIIAIRYNEFGHTKEIKRLVVGRGINIDEIDYTNLPSNDTIPFLGRTLVDVTGLAKPVLFWFIRAALKGRRGAYVVYTAAKRYYPLEKDLKEALGAYKDENHHLLLSSLKNLLTGEAAPYQSVPLLDSRSDDTRLRGLCAFSSPKHERLLQLIDDRDFDQLDVIVHDDATHRSKIAQIAASVAIRGTQNATLSRCNASNPAAVMELMAKRYENWYVQKGLNFEIGLTGNKMEAVAAAVLSAAVHVSQCWYVKPSAFDKHRFTSGVGETRCFEIERRIDEDL